MTMEAACPLPAPLLPQVALDYYEAPVLGVQQAQQPGLDLLHLDRSAMGYYILAKEITRSPTLIASNFSVKVVKSS